MLVASGAGLVLTLTASPAMAAPPTDPGSNRAQVTKSRTSGPNYTDDYRSVSRTGDGHSFTNSRQKVVYDDDGTINDITIDAKYHSMQNDNVQKSSYQQTTTRPNQTCRSSGNTVVANGETRTEKSRFECR